MQARKDPKAKRQVAMPSGSSHTSPPWRHGFGGHLPARLLSCISTAEELHRTVNEPMTQRSKFLRFCRTKIAWTRENTLESAMYVFGLAIQGGKLRSTFSTLVNYSLLPQINANKILHAYLISLNWFSAVRLCHFEQSAWSFLRRKPSWVEQSDVRRYGTKIQANAPVFRSQ